MKSSTKHLRLFMIALFTCIACVCLVFGVTACSGGKSSGAIDLSETNVTISVGETHTITATATEKNGGEYTGNYVWSCDGDAVSITSDGNTCIMTGVSAGKASIIVTAGSYSVRCDVTVIDSSTSSGTKNVETVSIEPDALKLYTGQSSTVSASLTVTGGTTYTGDYEWESSDVAVATVTKGENGSCTITAVGAGTATITVTVGAEGARKQAACAVTVEEDSIATLELSEEAIVVAKEGASTLVVTVKMTSGESSTDFKAEIENLSIATIEVSGNTITVTGIGTGETKITVTAGGITKECTVTVKEPEIAEITLSKTSVTLGTDETVTVDIAVKLDNGKTTDEYTATASCDPEDIVTANVASGILTITAGETEGSAKITITVVGTTISAECSVTVADVQKEYHIDFSEPDTYEWIGTPATQGTDNETGETFMYLDVSAGTYETGILSFVAISGQTINKENVGALFTSSKNSTYFVIDLSGFEGSYVSVKVKMDANGSGSTRTLYVNNTGSNSSGIKSVSSSNKGDYGTLEYGQLISAGDVLYLTWDANIRIFTIDIEIQDASEIVPEVRGVTLDKTSLSLYVEETDYLTATVEMTIGSFTGTYEWSSSDETVARVEGSGNGATVIAEGVGTAIITVKAGEKEATCTVTVVERGEENQVESFVVPMTVDGSTPDSTTYSSGSVIADNSLFNLTATSALKYGAEVSGVSFTDIYGNTVSPDQGLKFSDVLAKSENDTTEIRSAVTITAKEDITVYVTMQFTADGYSGNRAGKVMYSIDDGESVTWAESTNESKFNRNNLIVKSIELEKGQALTILAENLDTSNSANFWLFGVEAMTEGAVTGGDEGYTGVTYAPIDGYEWVPNPADLQFAGEQLGGFATEGNDAGKSSKVSSGGLTVGSFTFAQGIYFEDTTTGISNKYDFNNQGDNVTITMTGVYNDISFYAKTTTSGKEVSMELRDQSTNELVYTWTGTEINADLYTDAGILLGHGTYVLVAGSQAARVSDLTIYEYIEKSDPTGITATANTADFLKGRSIDANDLGLIVTITYANGNTKDITSGYTVDLDYTNLQVGENEITVSYSYTEEGDGGQEHTFSTTVTIYLYELESIEISDFSMALVSGTYYTNNVQKIYLVGDTVSYDYAAVTGTASYGTGNDKVSTTFIIASSEVSFATADSTGAAVTSAFSAEGAYTVTATVNVALAANVSSSYTINVVDATNADITTVKVLAPSDVEDAEQATYAVGEDGVITVATINDAIQLIKLLGAPDNVRKYIYVGAGQYWEKIYIDIPNLTLVGANSSETGALATRQDSATGGTEIVYWAFNGLMDPSGTTNYSTVGSATVTVAKEAVGFCAANITFRNYWNTNALYLECKAMYNDTQADAAYINADKSYFYNVTFTGYHDTLEAENGRQYYDHCYIEGRTDYIFGNTATCYFYYCNIHTIGAGDANNGGYVMAIKGTGVDYGYIFNYCNFTTDLETYCTGSDVDEDFKYTVEGTVSVARTWSGSDMHIAILNSSFDAGFSKEAYIASTGKGESGKNSRYTHMTAGQAPTPEYLVEYGNSGDGAISESLANTCTVCTNEADVANYLDFTKIFAIQNGSVKYDDDWSGHSVEVVTVTVTANGNTYTVNGYKNSLTIADVIAAVKSEDATVEITVLYDENNNALDETTKVIADMTLTADTAEADMTVPSSVTYDFGYGAADVTITESGYYGYLDIQLGTGSFYYNGTGWFILSGDATISVKLSAGSVISVNMYATDALLVNGEDVSSFVEGTEGSCSYTYTAATDGETVTFSAASEKTLYIGGISVTVYVTYNIGDTISFVSATGVSITGSVGEYAGIIVDATSGKLTDNNGSCCQIGEGLVLKIYSTPNASATVYFYQNDGTYAAKYNVETDENGVITITITGPADTNSGGTSNMYITSIEIVDKTT